MAELLLLLLSYLAGSIPFGLIITFLVKKIDLRKHGSGNIGATNVVRVVGKPWGFFVFVLDFLKGFFPPVLGCYLLASSVSYIFVLAALCAVCGHIWPIFLKFKGGKGVATSLGVIGGLGVIFPRVWIALVIACATWAVMFFVLRYVSLASLGACISFVISSFALSLTLEIKLLSVCLCVFIIFRHRQNIQRLLAKQEHRF